jgi:hypothetical protein
MDLTINNIIHDKLIKLIGFVLEKNPSADRIKINRKTKELNLRIIPKTTQRVLNTITDKKPVIQVKKSQFENYVLVVEEYDPIFEDIKNNKFVIDVDNQTIIGTENFKGDVEPLTKTFVEICHKYKLKYIVPLNLNTSDDLDEDTVIVNEIHGLRLNYAESESDDDNNED